jgi:peptidoglycan/xylan/chitin deacetylase (PgdA/CDA1 family)
MGCSGEATHPAVNRKIGGSNPPSPVTICSKMRKAAFIFLLLIPLGFFLTTPAQEGKQIAITFDDLPASNVSLFGDQVKINKRILSVLEKYEVEATGFVITSRLNGKRIILDLWLKAGHTLGNHTHTHMDFDKVDTTAFKMDVQKGVSEIEKLLNTDSISLRYFRFPYLHEGDTQDRKEVIRKFLKENGYTVAPVTINPKDSHYNTLYLKAWGTNDKAKTDSIKSEFLGQVKKKTQEAERLSKELFEREVKHVLLLHLNRMTAEVLDQVLAYYVNSGYSFVSLNQALEDSVYSVEETYIGSEELTRLERLKRSLKKH